MVMAGMRGTVPSTLRTRMCWACRTGIGPQRGGSVLLLFTNDVSPYFDTTGQYCNEGQGGPVFFLVGGPVNPTIRSCTIPAGKAVFAPIGNTECSSVEPNGFQGRNAQEARKCAASWIDGIDIKSLKFTIDGKKVRWARRLSGAVAVLLLQHGAASGQLPRRAWCDRRLLCVRWLLGDGSAAIAGSACNPL